MNIIWKRPDGTVAVTHLTDEAESLQAEAGKLKARGDVPFDWELVCTNAELPPDRHFRAAWTWETPEPKVDINFNRAVDVTKQRLREERGPKLAALDTAYMRADEDANQQEKSRIRTEKQRLRDITTLTDSCATLEELRALSVE